MLFVLSLEMDYVDLSKGISLRYGEPERWKKIAEKYGTTKPTRARSIKDADKKDYRPPDTKKALLKKSSKKRIGTDDSEFEKEISIISSQQKLMLYYSIIRIAI